MAGDEEEKESAAVQRGRLLERMSNFLALAKELRSEVREVLEKYDKAILAVIISLIALLASIISTVIALVAK